METTDKQLLSFYALQELYMKLWLAAPRAERKCFYCTYQFENVTEIFLGDAQGKSVLLCEECSCGND